MGTIQCPCYTACSTDLKFDAHYPEGNFCSTGAIASAIVSVSYEGETFEMNSESFVQCAKCSQEPNNCCFVHKNRNPNAKKGKSLNRSGYQNRKTGDFECKNRKTDLKSDRNRKTQKRNAPLHIREYPPHPNPTPRVLPIMLEFFTIILMLGAKKISLLCAINTLPSKTRFLPL